MKALSKKQAELLNYLKENLKPESTAQEMIDGIGWNKSQFFFYLNNIRDKGYFEIKPTNLGSTLKFKGK